MTAEQDRAAYRDTALKVLVVGISGVMAYMASTTQASPRVDYLTVAWLAIIALAIAAVGANPWSAYGWHFEPDKFVRALREVIDLPVVNVKED